jgi:formylglycine-generating enzyme required for sulfatase activity
VPVLTTITVSLSANTIQVGQTAGTMVRGTDQFGAPIATGAVTWSSSIPTVATVSASGSITALAPGETSVIATSGSVTGQAALTVIPVPVASVTVSPATASVVIGATQQLTATMLDANNAVLPGRPILWASSDTTKAKVSSTGLVTALSVGAATISATSEGKTGSATVTVVTSLLADFPLTLFASIPAGSFQMGTTVSASSEGPIHTVTLSRAFYMQKTELTQAQWRTVMGNDPSAWNACGDACPVENVSWNDIQTFLQALNARTPGVAFRLPTEAEWEYAARAGTVGNTYGALDDISWYSANSGAQKHAVGLKAANAFGLFDMIGNVYEFVSDFYGQYDAAPTTDPTGPTTGTNHPLRGGSFNDINSHRAGYRGSVVPIARMNNVGFRLVRVP